MLSIKARVEALLRGTLTALTTRGVMPAAPPAASQLNPCKDPRHGDFASNAAMVMAKTAGKKPQELALLIKEELLGQGTALVQSADVAGAGFLNLTLKRSVWQQGVLDILKAGKDWGRGSPAVALKVLVEFVSANPTGPLHVAHGRGTVHGDVMCRLLTAAGHEVTREFYINDFGNQVETLGRSVYLRYRELFGETVTLGKDSYPAEYVKDIAKELRERVGDSLLTAPQERWLPECTATGIDYNLKWIKRDLKAFNVVHDRFESERALQDSGEVKALGERLKQAGHTYEAAQAEGADDKVRRQTSKAAQYAEQQQGGTFLRTTTFGDEEDRVILRRNGSPAYFLADLCYHEHKYRRGYDRMVNVWGADHAGHVTRMRAGLRAMGLPDERLEFSLVQMVRLLRGGQEVRISKRTGNLLLLSELMEDIGTDAARYYFLLRAPSAQIDVDLDQAREQKLSNPVIYAQYGHARACAIFRKAAELGVPVGIPSLAALETLTLPEELALLRRMAAFPDRVAEAARALEPHRMVYELQELNSEFHSYYTKYSKTDRVISDDPLKTEARLGLIQALQVTMRNALHLMGVGAPERMSLQEEPTAEEGT